MSVGKGDRQTHCASHSPLPRPVASVKFSANKKKGRDRTEKRRGLKKTARHKNNSNWCFCPKDGANSPADTTRHRSGTFVCKHVCVCVCACVIMLVQQLFSKDYVSPLSFSVSELNCFSLCGSLFDPPTHQHTLKPRFIHFPVVHKGSLSFTMS